MKTSLSIVTLFIIIFQYSCQQATVSNNTITNAQIENLITNTWLLTNVGYDYNQNNQIDANESVIKSCEKDNELAFVQNGTGTITENQLSCSGNSKTSFHWRLQQQQFIISFTNHQAQLLSMNEKKLLFTTNNHSKGNLITEFSKQKNSIANTRCMYSKMGSVQF